MEKLVRLLLILKQSLHYWLSTKHRKRVIQLRNFYSQFLKSDDLFFDVGANFGTRIEPIIRQNIRIIAIEPQPECIAYLKRYGNSITVVPKALGGGGESEQTMYIASTNTMSSFVKGWIESERFSSQSIKETRKIPMTTLDCLIDQYGLPQMIKIDVEGYENEVLKGLSQPVKWLSFEYTLPEALKNTVLCIDQIIRLTNGKAKFNYSVGESMKWASSSWYSCDDMRRLVQSEQFIKSSCGDIYAKMF